MKKIIPLFSPILLLFLNSAYLSANSSVNYPKGFNEQKNFNTSFLENKGQVNDQNNKPRPDVLFSGINQGMIFHLRNNGISYQLSKVDNIKKEINSTLLQKREKIITASQRINIHRLDINWLNINTNSIIVKGKANEGYNNYYLNNCPSGILKVKNFEDITYKNIYNGIDLKWYQNNGQLKYDYIVAVGANFRQIELEIEGATEISINTKGELEFKTPLGTIIEEAPLVTQDGKILLSSWKVNKNKVSFDIQNINPNQSFIIDPPVRMWGTYYGGSANDVANSTTCDASGNVFIGGSTTSNIGTIIATVGSHQSSYNASTDAFLVKFDAAGIRQWGTYYGGVSADIGYSCATDATGNIYLAGSAGIDGSTAIATLGSHQPTYGGNSTDAFLVQFNSSGVRQWGTYYGGSLDDIGYSCATDATGNVYLAGHTLSTGGIDIATVGSHQDTYGGGPQDAFLVQFNSAGVRQWGTYYGGSAQEYGYSCSTDPSGNVYLAGGSNSNTGTVIATATSHQPVLTGNYDAYLVQFNSAGVRQWGTYYGGSAIDFGISCSCDASGHVYLCGDALSNVGTFIATVGSHQATNGGNQDAFLVQFNSAGVRQWGTYYGGGGIFENGESCATDPAGNVYLSGSTTSNIGTIIASAGSYQTAHGGGAFTNNAFLVQFNSSGVRQWGTYYGSSGGEVGNSCCTDAAGNIYLTGGTSTSGGTVIADAASHQPSYNGGLGGDAFLVKFFDNLIVLPVHLTLFTGIAMDNSVLLNWETDDINNLFEIEKSKDGVNFEKIGELNNNCSIFCRSDFEFIDNSPIIGINYYRLKQINYNGVSENSNSISINFNSETTNFYPNPASDYLIIESKNKLQTVSVKNLTGYEIIKKQINSDDFTISLESLVEGIYIISIDGVNHKLIIKR